MNAAQRPLGKESDRLLAQIFDECAERVLAGETLESCLARYPQHSADLEPLLQSVVRVRGLATVPPRAPEVAARSQAQFMAAARQMAASPGARQRSRLASFWDSWLASFDVLRPIPTGLVAAVVGVFLAGLLVTGVVSASANALPGDPLYSVKLATEQARLWFTHGAARDLLNNQIQEERTSEAIAVERSRRVVDQIPLDGTLTAFDPRQWAVAGLVVRIDSGRTAIVGSPYLGALVRGTMRAPGDGSLVATYLSVEPRPTPIPTPPQIPSRPQSLMGPQRGGGVSRTPSPTGRHGGQHFLGIPTVYATRTRRALSNATAPSSTLGASTVPAVQTSAAGATTQAAPMVSRTVAPGALLTAVAKPTRQVVGTVAPGSTSAGTPEPESTPVPSAVPSRTTLPSATAVRYPSITPAAGTVAPSRTATALPVPTGTAVATSTPVPSPSPTTRPTSPPIGSGPVAPQGSPTGSSGSTVPASQAATATSQPAGATPTASPVVTPVSLVPDTGPASPLGIGETAGSSAEGANSPGYISTLVSLP